MYIFEIVPIIMFIVFVPISYLLYLISGIDMLTIYLVFFAVSIWGLVIFDIFKAIVNSKRL